MHNQHAYEHDNTYVHIQSNIRKYWHDIARPRDRKDFTNSLLPGNLLNVICLTISLSSYIMSIASNVC